MGACWGAQHNPRPRDCDSNVSPTKHMIEISF